MKKKRTKMVALDRKLAALGFPSTRFFRSTDDLDLKSLLIWIDDIALHQLGAQRQQVLKAGLFDDAFVHYLQRLECPHALSQTMSSTERDLLVDWLLGFAIQHKAVERVVPMDNDINATIVHDALLKLAQVLDIPTTDDDSALAKSICHVLARKLNHFNVIRAEICFANNIDAEQWQSKSSTQVWEGEPFPLGFETGDLTVDKLATVLRMLYIGDLRELQWHVNEVIAICQSLSVSALDDPKANLQLSKAKHGR